MKRVEVLLREHVDKVGRCGDVVQVSAGYARNFLLPRHLAVPATEENKRMMVRRAERLDAEEAARSAELEARVGALSNIELKCSEKADDTGSLYGSVSAANISTMLGAMGFPINEKDVRLEHPIKTAGTHEVPIHVHGEHFAKVTVTVEAAAE